MAGQATLRMCDPDTPFDRSKQGAEISVDFDPASLELGYTVTTQSPGAQPTSTGAQAKAAGQQTAQNATLTMTLLFDTTSANTSVQDRTEPIVELTVPTKLAGDNTPPPRKTVLFQWGTFTFVGNISSLSQTIDFFSASGTPLRSTVHLTLSRVDPSPPSSGGSSGGPAQPSFGANASAGASFGASASASFGASASAGASFGVSASASAAVGTVPLTLSQSGQTVQSIAAATGGVSWRAVATANDIDNPRLLPPGTVLAAGASFQAGV